MQTFREYLESITVQQRSAGSKSVQDWAKQFGIAPEQLIQAVRKIATSANVQANTFLNQKIVDKVVSMGLIPNNNTPQADPFGNEIDGRAAAIEARKKRASQQQVEPTPDPYHSTLKVYDQPRLG
jgi:hypothetical protein